MTPPNPRALSEQGGQEMRADASISPCGRYRYWLTREWEAGCFKLPIIMLNPSTADASNDDRTIGRCVEFARREGFGGIVVMNLFAFRATSPDAMKSADDPFGPKCARHLDKLMTYSVEFDVPILAAWGAHGGYRDRAAQIMASAKGFGARLVSLGITKDGHPRHPLYVKGDQPFEPFPRLAPGNIDQVGVGDA